MPGWLVHKFGGTSLASAERFLQAASIVLRARQGGDGQRRQAVVVSAMGDLPGVYPVKVTDVLLQCGQRACRGLDDYEPMVEDLRKRHVTVAKELLGSGKSAEEFEKKLLADLDDLRHILRALRLHCRLPEERDLWWSGLGELWSADLMMRLLQKHLAAVPGTQSSDLGPGGAGECALVDGRDVFEVTWDQSGARVNCETSGVRWRQRLASSRSELVVVTGYLGRMAADGSPTTLGRDGSDYTATALARIVTADSLTIWKDVDGVYSANPKKVPGAVCLGSMSYKEAMELSFFGSKVLHPSAMTPIIASGVPVWVRNSFRPEAPGTCIHTGRDMTCTVAGVSAMSGLALLTIEGSGMAGVQGVAARLFGALCRAAVNVVLITQASSEVSITVAVRETSGTAAVAAVRREFREEVELGLVQSVECESGFACVAVVGDGMANRIGLAASLFGALASASVNVRCISQGSTERNVSVVVSEADADRALVALHAAEVESVQAVCAPILSSTEPPPSAPPKQCRTKDDILRRLAELAAAQRVLMEEERELASQLVLESPGAAAAYRGAQLMR